MCQDDRSAIEGAEELGVDAERAAAAAATGALEAADQIGNKAMDSVRKAVVGTIRGVRVVVAEPFRGTGIGAGRS